jgi:hypothetical protein
MKLNVTGNWTVIVATMAIVALTGITLTAFGSGLQTLAFAGLAGIAAVIATAASIVALTLRYDRRAATSSLARVTHLPVTGETAEHTAAA